MAEMVETAQADGTPPQRSEPELPPFWGAASLAVALVVLTETMLLLTSPPYGSITNAKLGALAVRNAAELSMNVDGQRGCPTVEDLVLTRRLERRRTSDPFGSPYRIVCELGRSDDDPGVRVWSSGWDRIPFTADDIRDDMKIRELQRLASERDRVTGRSTTAPLEERSPSTLLLVSLVCPPWRLFLRVREVLGPAM
jgi:hypothetical protein